VLIVAAVAISFDSSSRSHLIVPDGRPHGWPIRGWTRMATPNWTSKPVLKPRWNSHCVNHTDLIGNGGRRKLTDDSVGSVYRDCTAPNKQPHVGVLDWIDGKPAASPCTHMNPKPVCCGGFALSSRSHRNAWR